jgi:hypothetical protein
VIDFVILGGFKEMKIATFFMVWENLGGDKIILSFRATRFFPFHEKG